MKLFQLLMVIIACYLIGISDIYGQTEKLEAFYQQVQKSGKDQELTLSFVQESAGLVEEYSKLYQIILVRHGKPRIDKSGWRSRNEAAKYIKDYDSVGVYEPQFIPVIINPDEVEIIHTSNLNRSISTARQVFEREDLQQASALFKEYERKICSFPNIKLPLKWWQAGARILWYMGLNDRGIESFSEAKQRTNKAVEYLQQDAFEHGKTLLVSHGLLNHYLVKNLKKRGWKQVYNGGNGYLSQKMLVKYIP